MPTQSRQLAAIMFTDIVGYTALMSEDEQKAFELLKKNRQVNYQIRLSRYFIVLNKGILKAADLESNILRI